MLSRLCAIFTLLLFTLQPANAHVEGGLASFHHCPFNATFIGVQIVRTVNNHFLLQCFNSTGATYFTQIANYSLAPDDTKWFRQDYPLAWICFGEQPEDCKFYEDDNL